MDHRGTVGRIYKEEHYILLQTKYESSGPCGFGEDDFLCFNHDRPPPRAGPVWTPGAWLAGFIKRTTIRSGLDWQTHCKSMGANDPRGGAIFDPWGMIGRIYIEDH